MRRLKSQPDQEGDLVKEGDLLVEIDPRPFQVQLEQAEGQLAKDQAQVGQAEANLIRDTAQEKYARTEAERYGKLVQEGVIAKDQGEQLLSNADSLAGTLTVDRAAINSAKAQITADKAAIDSDKLNLIYCHITSPINGRVGLRLVDPGNIVHATDTNGLAVITQIQPISVVFTVAEDQLQTILKKMSGQRLAVDAFDREISHKIAEGRLSTVDNEIDQTTGTVRLRANFDNKDGALFPNQFVNARLLVEEKHNVILLPTAAIQRTSQSTYVYVVNSDSTVSVRQISVGTIEGDDAEIAPASSPAMS
jgi:multidrug efflux system membrane fusion protein